MALAERFFTDRSAGLPVLFFVDDEVLGDVYGGDADGAVASITDAVRRRLGRSNDYYGYFQGIARAGRTWKREGGNCAPPFLDLLAICVLAATRMGTGDYAPNNYYAQLRDLLDIADDGMPRGFDDSLDAIWGMYVWWLDERLQGARGLSTVVTDAPFAHVGRPQSQTLFLGSDIGRLDDFFRWIELKPGEEVDPNLLALHFRAWAPDEELSVGARRVLEHREFWPMLGGILAGYARHWDGTRSDRVGNRTARLHLVVQLRFPKAVSIKARQPDGYPDHLDGWLGGLTASATATDGVFVVNAPIDSRYLRRDGSLGNPACRLTLSASDIYIFRIDAELGGWASVDAFLPGDQHCVLASPSVADDVGDQLNRWSSEPVTCEAAPGGFSAWRLFRNVVLEGGEPFEGALAGRRPTLRHRFTLHGGLPLDARLSYLSGGAPDVWLPPTTEESIWVALDGERVDAVEDKVRLAAYLRPDETGSHVVDYGGAMSQTIRMIESHALVPPLHDQPGHAILVDDDGGPVEHSTLARIEEADQDAVTVVGPHVRGAVDRWAGRPLLLRRRADRAWLLGCDSTQVLAVERPPEPSWMRQLRLSGQLYEAEAPFPIQYSIEFWPSGKRVARQRGNSIPGDLSIHGDAGMWAELLLTAELAHGDADLWEEYQAAAELIQQECGSQSVTGGGPRDGRVSLYVPPAQTAVDGYEQLLHWVAERGTGTFREFQDAHAWATEGEVPGLRTLRVLSTLGYVEVDWRAGRWGAVSPTVTLLPNAGGYGLIVGARTACLRRTLSNVEEPDVLVEFRAQEDAPDVCFVAADTESALAELAEQLGLSYVHSVSERVADVLPTLDAMLRPYRQPAIVDHYGVERFDLDANFVPVDEDRGPGLYKYEVSGPPRLQFADDDDTRYRVDLAVGTWAEARRLTATNLLDWRADGVNGELRAPWMLPLPVLHARAAALCTGLPPRNDHAAGEIVYLNVPEWLANKIAESLGQQLEYVTDR